MQYATKTQINTNKNLCTVKWSQCDKTSQRENAHKEHKMPSIKKTSKRGVEFLQ